MELNLTSIKKMNIIQDNDPVIALLQRTPLFCDIDILIIHSLVSKCDILAYDEGTVILSE